MALEAETVIKHDVSRIITAYTSKDFHEHLATKVGSELRSFEVAGTPDGGYQVTSQQAMSVDRLPDIAKKIVKGEVLVTVEETWSAPDDAGSRRSDMSVKIQGAPVSAAASQNLHARDGETLSTVRGDITVKIPLIGNKVKSAAEPYMRKFVELQAREVSKWIEKNG